MSGLIVSIINFAVGVILVKYPGESLRTLCFAFGFVTLALGLVGLGSYLFNRNKGLLAGLGLAFGIVMTAISVVLIITPDLVVSIVPFLVGLVILFQAIGKMQQALELRDVKYDKWWSMLLVGILMLALGALIVFNPFDSAAVLVRVIGIVFIVNGILGAGGTIFTKRQVKKYGPAAAAKDTETGEVLETEVIDADGNVIGEEE